MRGSGVKHHSNARRHMQITERHITNEVRPPTVCNNIQHVNRVKSGKKLKCKTTNGKTREQIFDGKGGRKWMGAFTYCVTILLCFTEEAFKVSLISRHLPIERPQISSVPRLCLIRPQRRQMCCSGKCLHINTGWCKWHVINTRLGKRSRFRGHEGTQFILSIDFQLGKLHRHVKHSHSYCKQMLFFLSSLFFCLFAIYCVCPNYPQSFLFSSCSFSRSVNSSVEQGGKERKKSKLQLREDFRHS